MEMEDGEKMVLHKDKIKSIEFDNTVSAPQASQEDSKIKADPEFASPIKTFLYWKEAAIKGDLEKMAECFAASAKSDQLKQLKSFSKKQIRDMRSETKKTKFTLSQPLIDGNQAYLMVTRERKGAKSKQAIEFAKEGPNWKMVPE